MFLMTGAFVLGACSLPSTPESPKVVGKIRGPDGGWDFASFDESGRRVLVSRSYGVMAIDVASGAVSKLAVGDHVHASFVVPNTRVLIANGDSNTVTLANGLTGDIEVTIPVGDEPDAAVYDPFSERAFVMNAKSGDVSVIDTTQGKEDTRISVGGHLEASAIDGSGKLFVNVEDKAEVAVIDTRAAKLVGRFKVAGCEEPTAIAFVATVKQLVTTCSNGHAKVIDAGDGHEVMDINIGPHPDSALVDELRGRLFIATAGSLTHNGEITVLNIRGPAGISVVERIATQRGARTLAEDPVSGRLYLPTATYAVGANAKPHTVDGTFKVLVVAP
jgi:YVTN family beta-propeller protein